MHALAELWRSAVVRKVLAAVSGLLLSSWVALHVAGNLTLFRGAAVADGYAATLRAAPVALSAGRLGRGRAGRGGGCGGWGGRAPAPAARGPPPPPRRGGATPGLGRGRSKHARGRC